jgi:hypothetical protein
VPAAAQQPGASSTLIAGVAVATAIILANPCYSQPLIATMVPDLGARF